MTNSQHLREQMWDLVYGLLEADESQTLIAQIKSDPAAARLYAEVRLQADLVGYAARVEDPSVVFTADATAEKPAPVQREKTAAAASKERPAAKHSSAKRAARGARAGAWLALGAATALAALLAVGQFWPAPSPQQLAMHYIVTDVEAPPSIPGGLGNSLAFQTTTLDGEPHAATVDFAIRGREGRELFRQQVQTDDSGRATAEIPGSALEPGVRLEVFDVAAADAVSAQKLEESEAAAQKSPPASSKLSKLAALTADLPVQAEPQMAYILLEEPPAEGDKTVNASVWNFYAFSGKPAPPETAEQIAQNIPGLSLADEGAAAVQQGVFKGLLQNNLQNQTPRNEPRSRAAFSFSNQSQAASASRSGGFGFGAASQAESAAGAAPPQQQQSQEQPAQQQLAQQPAEELQKKLDSASNPQGTLGGRQQLAQQAKQQKLNELAQSSDGYGTVRFNRALPNPAAIGRAPLDAAPDRSNAPAAGNEFFASAATSVAPGQPIHVEIPPEYAGKPLVVAANARGVMVANTSVPATAQAADRKRGWDTQRTASRVKQGQLVEDLQIELPPEADGPIEVALLDPASSPPQVVSRNYIYREPARKLQIDVHELKERFTPGERVQVTLAVRDEVGRPAADTRLGVRLWNEDLVQQLGQQSAEHPLLLAEALQAGLPGATTSQLALAQSGTAQSAGTPLGGPQSGDGRSRGGQLPAVQVPANPAPATPSEPASPAATSSPSPPADAKGEQSRREATADLEAAGLEAKRLATRGRAVDELERLASAKDKAAPSVRSAGAGAGSPSPAPFFDQSPVNRSPSAEALSTSAPATADFSSQPTDWFDNLATAAEQEPVELATNRPAVQAAYDAAAAAAFNQRRQILRALGGAAIFGGMALLVLIAILAARRAAGSIGIMLPAVVVSLASLLIGCLWIGWHPYSPLEAHIAISQRPLRRAATPAVVATAESAPESTAASTSEARSRGTIELTTDRETASAPATIPLASPADAVEASGPAVRLLRDTAALAGVRAGSGAQTTDAPQASPDADRQLALGGLAGASGRPAPSVPATAAGQPLAARTEGAPATPVPASLYFNPNLQTNDQGLATIEFTVPPANSQYRLLIDALGNGRIGSRQDLITIQGESAK